MMKQKSWCVVVSQTPFLPYFPLSDQQHSPGREQGSCSTANEPVCTRAGLTCAGAHCELVHDKEQSSATPRTQQAKQAFAPLWRCCHNRRVLIHHWHLRSVTRHQCLPCLFFTFIFCYRNFPSSDTFPSTNSFEKLLLVIEKQILLSPKPGHP